MTKADFTCLIEALERYFEAVQAQKSPNPPDLKPVFNELDEAEARVLPIAPPRLKHFLEGKSYRKAYNFLTQDGAESPSGCGK